MSTDQTPFVTPPSGAPWPAGYGRIVLDQTTSTMEEAARRAPSLDRPTWIMAHRQTAGRGRRGRPWVDPVGNFAATLVLHPSGGPALAALRSFVAANALYDALAVWVDVERLSLKWPNDVLIDGRKVAGILLESGSMGGRTAYLAIGVGVNLRAAPMGDTLEPGALAPACLADLVDGDVPTPERFLDQLARTFQAQETKLETGGFAPVRDDWLARAAHLGGTIRARTGTGWVTGRFDSVDLSGQLILQTPTGVQAIAAADVYFAKG